MNQGPNHNDAVALSRAQIEQVFRAEYGRVVAVLIKLVGDFDRAEDLAAEAFRVALERWPVDGLPERPGAWLTTVARRRGLDALRSAKRHAQKHQSIVDDQHVDPLDTSGLDDQVGYPDERLRLIFTCCHPDLPMPTRLALTLRTLGGLETPEIARAFLVPESTMAQRLVRAKKAIKKSAIPYELPSPGRLPQRLDAVLSVLYLIFNEGYQASGGGSLMRVDLGDEAIRLGRLTVQLMPDAAEARGLVALMLLHHSRRHARLDAAGDLVVLEDQDRSAWDQDQIAEGLAALDEAVALRDPGPYQVQAAIAALHARAKTPAETDWPQILALYQRLTTWTDSPVVLLNRAVALAMAQGPQAGLAVLEELAGDKALAGYHLLPAAQADLHRRAGAWAKASGAYARALALVSNEAERRYLERRKAQVDAELATKH